MIAIPKHALNTGYAVSIDLGEFFYRKITAAVREWDHSFKVRGDYPGYEDSTSAFAPLLLKWPYNYVPFGMLMFRTRHRIGYVRPTREEWWLEYFVTDDYGNITQVNRGSFRVSTQ